MSDRVYIWIMGFCFWSLIVCFFGLIFCIVMEVLTGCTTKPIPAVYDCPVIKLPQVPRLYTLDLSSKSTAAAVVKSYAADLSAYKAWCHIVQQQVASQKIS